MKSRTKTVLITGCSAGGIGHALAKEFHSEGLHVVATARRQEAMQELSALGSRMTTLVLDVTDRDAIRKVRDELATLTGGKLDILINNAGQAYPVAVTDMDMDEVRALFELNLFAPIILVQEFVHLLIASKDGRIANIGSVSGLTPIPFSAAYNASKAALHAFGNTLRVELAPFNVKVLNVISGSVRSNIAKPRTIPENSLYKPMEDIYQAKRVNTSQSQKAIPANEYARIVVAEILKPNPRRYLWAGGRTWIIWFVDTFLGQRAFDWIMTRTFGLSEFSARINGTKTKTA